MKCLITLASLVIILCLPAICQADVAYRFGSKSYQFYKEAKAGNVVSSQCRKFPTCDALIASAKIFKFGYGNGGQNPASIICQHQAGGHVVIGLDHNGNENSFCRFQDGSMIDSGSLTRRGKDRGKANS